MLRRLSRLSIENLWREFVRECCVVRAYVVSFGGFTCEKLPVLVLFTLFRQERKICSSAETRDNCASAQKPSSSSTMARSDSSAHHYTRRAATNVFERLLSVWRCCVELRT